jgi:hypothetical protein
VSTVDHFTRPRGFLLRALKAFVVLGAALIVYGLLHGAWVALFR